MYVCSNPPSQIYTSVRRFGLKIVNEYIKGFKRINVSGLESKYVSESLMIRRILRIIIQG